MSGTRPPASHDLTNVIYRGVAGKEKGGQGRAPSPYQLLLDKLVKSNLLWLNWLGVGAGRPCPDPNLIMNKRLIFNL